MFNFGYLRLIHHTILTSCSGYNLRVIATSSSAYTHMADETPSLKLSNFLIIFSYLIHKSLFIIYKVVLTDCKSCSLDLTKYILRLKEQLLVTFFCKCTLAWYTNSVPQEIS